MFLVSMDDQAESFISKSGFVLSEFDNYKYVLFISVATYCAGCLRRDMA